MTLKPISYGDESNKNRLEKMLVFSGHSYQANFSSPDKIAEQTLNSVKRHLLTYATRVYMNERQGSIKERRASWGYVIANDARQDLLAEVHFKIEKDLDLGPHSFNLMATLSFDKGTDIISRDVAKGLWGLIDFHFFYERHDEVPIAKYSPESIVTYEKGFPIAQGKYALDELALDLTLKPVKDIQ